MKWISTEELANILKGYREENNMNKNQLAKKLGVSRSLVGDWESGVSYPSIKNLRKIAALLGVSPKYLIERLEL